MTTKPTGSRVALLGFGTVGQAVARILSSGEVPHVTLTHVFNRNVGSKRVEWVPPSVRWTESPDEILSSPDIDVVIELVGGLHPAYEWVRSALMGGKSVVTANKQLMAHFGTELIDLARAQKREIRFEASVAGGIPVLRALQEGLAGDRLVEVRGILNGTCNYILSRMQAEAVPFADVLAEAQKAGYAEADPTEDVDGADAAAKLAIIAAVGLRRPVRVSDIATRSIRPIEPVDFEYARQLGCTIRQIARASAEDSGSVFAAVRPALVPLSSAFGRNEGSQNLVTVRGVFGGETSFSGHGAGGSPTAVAVVSDVLSVRRGADEHATPVPSSSFHKVSGDFVAPHYVRFIVNDKPGILAQVTTAYARYGINIEGVLQLPKFRKDRLPFVTTLEECSESVLDRALAEVAQSDYHVQPPLSLPIFLVMTAPHGFSEVVEAEGHLIDSQILNAVFDTVVKRNASFDVLKFKIGRSNDEPSEISMRISAATEQALGEVLEELVALGCRLSEQHDALLRNADRDGCVPDDFYSTTNHRTLVRYKGKWIDVQHQRMDAVIVISRGKAACRKLRDVRVGDSIVCGVGGVRVMPEFRDRDRLGFAFMTNEISSERRVEVGVTRIATMMRDVKAEGGRIAVVAGPVVVHTGGSPHFQELIREGYVDVLLSGNALAVHDVEQALFGTSLGVDLDTGKAIEGGHRHHMRAINTICRAGGLKQAVEHGVLKTGIMFECIQQGIDYVLAGSIRDDGPLPDTIMDLRAAQDRYAAVLEDVKLVLSLSTMLHGIGVGNMLPSWVKMVSVDINPAVVTKLADRGSSQTLGIVTDVGLFLHRLAQKLRSA